MLPPRGVNKNGERTEHRSLVIHGGNEEGTRQGGRRRKQARSRFLLRVMERRERLAFLPGKIKNGGGVACKVSRQTADGGERESKEKSGAVLRNKSCPDDDEGKTSEAERRARQKKGPWKELHGTWSCTTKGPRVRSVS